MPIIAITREMGSLGKDVARGLGEALSLPVIRLLDGSAGLFERLTADKTSLAIYTADEIYGIAASCTNKG
ncbi:MAG: cytidylate kinase-like family protein [Betaproteobacteria bacterium]|nr:MAG: cytidylate kinase-like family protein [Betaproteobacteria bacterium]